MPMPAHRLPPDRVMDCEHITHPEHWLGDCGDVARHFFPMPVMQQIVDETAASLVSYLGIDPAKVTRRIDLTGQRFPIA